MVQASHTTPGRGVEGAHDFFGKNSANTDSIRQAKGEPGKALVPTSTLETNIQMLNFLFMNLIPFD